MGERPSRSHTLDRYPDANGNYEPGNCRWATKREQARNLRNAQSVTINGETKNIFDWAELSGISVKTLAYRYRTGCPPERFLSPVNLKLSRHHAKPNSGINT